MINNILFIFIALSSLLNESYGQSAAYENPGEYDNDLIKEIVQIPRVEQEAGIFMGSKFRYSIGPAYHRYNVTGVYGNNDALYSELSTFYNLRWDYYFGKIFSIFTEFYYNEFNLRRYDEQLFTRKKFYKRKLSIGPNFNFKNFYIGYKFSHTKTPILFHANNDVQQVSENIFSHEVYTGYRIPIVIDKLAMDITVGAEQYIQKDSPSLESIRGSSINFGFRLYTTGDMSFGIETYEEINKYITNGDVTKVKEFKIVPFFRY